MAAQVCMKFHHKYRIHTRFKDTIKIAELKAGYAEEDIEKKINKIKMAWSENEDRAAKTALNLDTNKNCQNNSSPGLEASHETLAIEQSLMRSATLRGNPPALIRGLNSHSFLNPKTESLSDGELSDFSLNDTEEDEEEFRNCVLLNGSQNEGNLMKIFI